MFVKFVLIHFVCKKNNILKISIITHDLANIGDTRWDTRYTRV